MTTQPSALWKSALARPMHSGELPPSRTVCTRRLCLPQLVQAAAALHPESVALAGPDGAVLTYGDLDVRSSRLAGYLHTLGVRPEVPVAICLERSFDSVIAALAVWKAGGAYLPLDPAWPVDRRQTMVEDSQSPVLISTSALAFRARYLVDLDLDAHAIAREPSVFTPLPVKRDHLACVIYTGSDRPKGVEMTHGNLLNLVFWHRRAFGVTPADRASHVAGLAADSAVWELWPYLSAGAAVAIPPEPARTSPERLRDWLTAQSITIGFVPAALAEPLIASRWARSTALRYLLTGGDALHRYPNAGLPFRLVNHYGSAECTVVATSGEIAAEPEAALPPIGAPVSNTQVYVLDRHQRPVAAGKIGEMYIGGTGVARGYRNRADLTAEHFLENPFSPSSSARMYRTGDLGRVLPDGRVSFCGRSDDQEEIRGHRIKAHEIVRVLDRHPGVVSSAIATHGEGWHKRLVAYVVPASGAHLTSGVLGDFLRRQLPDYMVPSAFVSLAELPLTSSGKLDHAALPDASKENCLAGSGFRGPTNPVERQVTSMLRDVLHLEPVGLDDHFCPVDGDSSSAQLIRRVRERFSVELSPHDLTEAQTVMKLAAEIERRMLTQLDSLTEEEAGRLLSLDAASARP